MSTPSYVVHSDDIPEEESAYKAPFDAEKLSFSRGLSKAVGISRIGLWHERLPPGRRLSFTHAHSAEDELVYVLEGACNMRVVEPGKEPFEVPLRRGHVVGFPAGTGIAHTFVNRGQEDCALLVVGEHRPGEDLVFYAEDLEYDAHVRETRPQRYWSRK